MTSSVASLNPPTWRTPKQTESNNNNLDDVLTSPNTPLLNPIGEPLNLNVGLSRQNDDEFLAKSTKGWIHGVKVPYSVFKYDLLENTSSNRILSKDYDYDYFTPLLVLDEVDHKAFGSTNSDSKRSLTVKSIYLRLPDDEAEAEGDILRKDDIRSPFSAYYSIPRTSLNIPNCYKDDKVQVKMMKDIPKLCYQNHFDFEEITYTFGGIYVSLNTNFRSLGLPRNVDLDKVSVHFPVDLPPFVNKEILTNPFMNQNQHFFAFNPARGTITYLDTINLKDFPCHLNSLVSTQISQRHVFFYGGFELKTESVYYNPEIDRWIIKKKLKLNEDGYILDVITLKFSKVELKVKLKDPSKTHIGKLGCGITANIFDVNDVNKDLPARIPLPPIFTDNRKDKLAYAPSPSLRPVSSPKSGSQHVKLTDTYSVSSSITANQTNASINTSTTNNLKKDEPETPASPYTSVLGTFPFLKQMTNQSTLNSVTQLSIESSNSKSYSSGSNLKTTLTNNLANTSSGSSTNSLPASSTTSRMSKVFSKSTKYLHRHTSQRNEPKSSHPLKNTYSKQVKENRSITSNANNGTSNGSGSRPVSPIQKPKAEQPVPLKVDTKNADFVPLVRSTPSPDHFRNFTPQPEAAIQVGIKKPFSAPTGKPDLGCDLVICDLMKQPSRDDESIDSFERDIKNEGMFYDSLLKSGLNGVSIFIFGGFYSETDETGYQKFVACNELLKIDLAIEDTDKGMSFNREALVFNIGLEKECPMDNSEEWPSPRGFFAFSLIDHKRNQDLECEWNLHDSEEFYPSKLKRPTSPLSASSHCSASFHTGHSISNETSKSASKGSTENFFSGKAFVVQGGCNDDFDFFSDFYIFKFDECRWEKLSTYLYDYFNVPLEAGGDDDGASYSKENELDEPALIEAELRACHHTALYYRNEERDYLFFMGGFRNDYLRYFDEKPYETNNFEVTRFTMFPFATNNSNLLRIPVLNLQTQTWKFIRYYYDVNSLLSDNYVQKVSHNPSWVNARISNYAGSISLNGKNITICHGMAMPCPEKKKDKDIIELDIPTDLLLWGAHVHFVFPSL